jgi:diguanylate cyclase (GGDEF)-like protein/PAS domain S-box-containing protein
VTTAASSGRLEAARREQTPQALARLVVVGLFIVLWCGLWLTRIPMPLPFLIVLCAEAAFFVLYLRVVAVLPSERSIRHAHYVMLASEIVFHTTMVYFLGGATWLGAFAYIFGLIFTNAFLDLRRGFVYTLGGASSFVSLVLLDATGAIPHYHYLDDSPLRYSDPSFVITTVVGGIGVFFSIYLWVNWVGRQLRVERDIAVSAQDSLVAARRDLENANADLESRVRQRTVELERAVGALRGGEELLRSTIESTADGILVVDNKGKVALTNNRFAEMWGIPADLLRSRDDARLLQFVVDQLVDPAAFLAKVDELYGSDAEDLDTINFLDGRVFERYSRPLMSNAAISGRVWSFRDVSDRKRFEAQLVHIANHDPLTSLFNRRRFNEEVERQLASSRRYNVHGALLFIDVDQFKDVNDSRGHRAGDELLTSLSRLLRERLRETDIIARLGGDEFAILLPHTSGTEALAVANELLDAIRGYIFITAGAPLRISASIGVALYPSHSTDAGELLSRADLAMYQSKEHGRNRATLFEPDAHWQAEIESRIGWHQRIHEALEQNLFVLHAQPIADVRTGVITQHELLIRVSEPDGGVVLPGAFLDIAERSGLIQSIDRWVVQQAIDLIAAARDEGRRMRLEVNLSGKAFADPGLLPIIQDRLAQTRIDPSDLVLEVTETAAIANLEDAERFVQRLRSLGCGFALDDFGVGFSSFAHLKYLPVDYLKIDGSFIRDLARNPIDQHLVRAIVNVAHALGKRTIAEFVGDDDALALLREYGVDYAQGFHIGRPVPLSDLPSRSEAA